MSEVEQFKRIVNYDNMTLDIEFAEDFEKVRSSVARFINAKSSKES